MAFGEVALIQVGEGSTHTSMDGGQRPSFRLRRKASGKTSNKTRLFSLIPGSEPHLVASVIHAQRPNNSLHIGEAALSEDLDELLMLNDKASGKL